MSLIDNTTNTAEVFNKLLNIAANQFEVKVETSIEGYAEKYANKLLEKHKLPSYSTLKNISTTAYQNVLNNSGFALNLNQGLSPAVPAVNNHLAPGTAVAAANNDKNNPSAAEAKSPANVPLVVLRYPLRGGDTSELVPYMKISGFKYKYDDVDQLGNMSSSEDATGKEYPDTERTATIRLPLPGNLASALELDFDDYSSVFAKIVRSSGGMDISPTGLGEAIGAVNSRVKDANAYGTGAAVGLAAGVFSKTIGSATLGEATGVAFSEALNYIRVASGIAVNPMQQASYVGSKIRHHAFEFNLVPRNAKEALEVKKIIQTLQHHSIGARINELGGILTDYPSVWNVTFHTHDGKLVNGLLSIPDAFLTNVNVTYSPTRAGFTVTRDNDPFAYVLSLVFKESQNLIRDDLSYLRQGEHLLKAQQPQTARGEVPSLAEVAGIYVGAANGLADTIVNAVKDGAAAIGIGNGSEGTPVPGTQVNIPTPPHGNNQTGKLEAMSQNTKQTPPPTK